MSRRFAYALSARLTSPATCCVGPLSCCFVTRSSSPSSSSEKKSSSTSSNGSVSDRTIVFETSFSSLIKPAIGLPLAFSVSTMSLIASQAKPCASVLLITKQALSTSSAYYSNNNTWYPNQHCPSPHPRNL